MPPAIEEEVLVDLVGENEQVMALGAVGDELELRASEHLSRRVPRRVDDDRTGVRSDRALEAFRCEASAF